MEIWVIKKYLRVYSVQNGLFDLQKPVLAELGNRTSRLQAGWVSAALDAVVPQRWLLKTGVVQYGVLSVLSGSYACTDQVVLRAGVPQPGEGWSCCWFRVIHARSPEPMVSWFTLVFLATSLSQGGLAMGALPALAKCSAKTNSLSHELRSPLQASSLLRVALSPTMSFPADGALSGASESLRDSSRFELHTW